MEYTIKELADLAGISTRTLRWYDKKGLLKPSRVNEAGYRFYDEKAVARLQQIMFYRELEFSLYDIGQILESPQFDQQKALQSHLQELTRRREQIDDLILTVQKTLAELQGGKKMSDREKFEAFKKKMVQENEEKYGTEIREKYGDESVDRANAAMMKMSEETYKQWKEKEDRILAMLKEAVLTGETPDSPQAQEIAKLHAVWCFRDEKYDPQKHAQIASLYTLDKRFTAYYDREVEGCAKFLTDAVSIYAKAKRN